MAPKLELEKHTTKLMCINEAFVETSLNGFALKNLNAENAKCVFKVANCDLKDFECLEVANCTLQFFHKFH